MAQSPQQRGTGGARAPGPCRLPATGRRLGGSRGRDRAGRSGGRQGVPMRSRGSPSSLLLRNELLLSHRGWWRPATSTRQGGAATPPDPCSRARRQGLPRRWRWRFRIRGGRTAVFGGRSWHAAGRRVRFSPLPAAGHSCFSGRFPRLAAAPVLTFPPTCRRESIRPARRPCGPAFAASRSGLTGDQESGIHETVSFSQAGARAPGGFHAY